jgi:signal transduction histidine kinase
VAAAVLIVLLGAAGSIVAARGVARSDAQKSQRAFAATSADVASRLNLAIRHEDDLVISTSAFIVANPHISNAKFNQWLQADRAAERYREILSFGRVVIVNASQLPSFEARAVNEHVDGRAPGLFHVIPPGNRPFYCFVDLVDTSKGRFVAPAGSDICANGAATRLIGARDSGQATYEPARFGKFTALGIQTPIYRGGVAPSTVATRRAAFIGSVGMLVMPKVVLDAALVGHHGTAVTIRYVASAAPVAFSSGVEPRDANSLTTDIHNGWTVQTFAAVAGAGVFSEGNALTILLVGIALSMLLGLLGVVLATGRARALRLVDEQTVELREQAAELREQAAELSEQAADLVVTVAELEAAQAIKDEFLALVSHELRSPLTSIRGYTEMLDEQMLTDEQHDWLGVVETNSGRLLSMVDDLLLMAEIQSGGLPLRLGEVILSDLIARSGEAAKPFAASKEIGIGVDCEQNIAAQGDLLRLGQVLDNLVSNAIKYTPNGGDVAITMTHTGDTATVAVRDTGIGIPKEEQGQMFERFFRTSNARISGIEGTGLGLAISRAIVEAHGGTIGFESVEGTGTTFRFTLPRGPDSVLASG